MKYNTAFCIRQIFKMLVQNVFLPVQYTFWHLYYTGMHVPKNHIVFADAHHTEIPFSMRLMKKELERRGYACTEYIYDSTRMGNLQSFRKASAFMKVYARAGVVFICDNFLPVSSCRKAKDTRVVQLWHSCGLLKKMGYDTEDDVPGFYLGNVYRNYDLVTVSAPCVEGPLTHGMRQKKGIVRATGVSRTDLYLDKSWREACRKHFYEKYPEAEGKTVILWTPTFRGNAADPKQVGTEEILQLEQDLGESFYLIRKVHPYIDARHHLSNCSIPTEELFEIADLLITDFSSTVFDYLFFGKPFVFFAPDKKEFLEERGLYVEYDSVTPYVAENEEELKTEILRALQSEDNGIWLRRCQEYHNGSCDGHSTERIIRILGL